MAVFRAFLSDGDSTEMPPGLWSKAVVNARRPRHPFVWRAHRVVLAASCHFSEILREGGATSEYYCANRMVLGSILF